jgi:single-stranded-DNA-specific exonuclease
VELLTEFDFEQAQQFASEIEAYNSERKDLDKLITKKRYNKLSKKKRTFYLRRFQEDWHKGVIGIVASRLIKPIIAQHLFYQSGDKYAASARSVRI